VYALYLVMDTLPGFEPRFSYWGPALMLAFDVFVTLSYIYLPNPIYHQLAFAVIMLSGIGRNVILIRRLPADHPARSQIARTMSHGAMIFVGGFAIWNIDNIFCTGLRELRSYVGPLGFVLEGHAYWHIMTAYGAFLISSAAIYLQMAIKVSPDAYTYDPSHWLPIVRPVASGQIGHASNGYASNGHASHDSPSNDNASKGHTFNGHIFNGHGTEGHASNGHAVPSNGRAREKEQVSEKTPLKSNRKK